MYKIYNVTDKYTGITGYWINKNDKLHIDNIIINSVMHYKNIVKNMFKRNEQAIFMVINIEYIPEHAVIIHDNGIMEQLNYKKVYHIKKDKNYKDKIYELCKKYGGITVYNNGTEHLKIEAWS